MHHPANVRLLSYDWQEATLAVGLPRPSIVEVVDHVRKQTLARTAEQNAVTRVRIESLDPDTEYDLEVRWDGGQRTVTFRTLPAPVGAMRTSFVAMSDPHVSKKIENRKGRLLVESASILRDLVEDINALDVDGVLVAGDVTNAGTAKEFDVAKRIFDQLRCPLFAAPGDHDLKQDCEPRWRASFGETSWVGEMADFAVAVLNTATGHLGSDGAKRLEEVLERPMRGVILVTHAQLLADDYIRFGRHKGIRDAATHRRILEALTQTPTLIYVGHQNVPSRVQGGALMQLNLPQPVQFPCGYILVREFENGFYHTYQPIRSAELSEASRAATHAAACNEPQWDESYRLGRDPGQANFLFAPYGLGG